MSYPTTRLSGFDRQEQHRKHQEEIEVLDAFSDIAGRLPESGGTLQAFEEESPEFKTIDDMEREHIAATLERCQWRVGGSKGAANLLGVPPSTLFSKMKKLKIVRRFDRGQDWI